MASIVSTEPTLVGNAGGGGSIFSSSTLVQNDAQPAHLPRSTSNAHDSDAARTTYHIYPEKERHKRIQSRIDLTHESLKSAAGRAARKAKKDAKKGVAVEPEAEPDSEAETNYRHCGGAFFLHSPYLAFHNPPQVLYLGGDEVTPRTPVMLIHGSAFWRKYKLQYGYDLARADVVDPRGVISWKHNGGNKAELKADDKKFKGYKVRTWRLWGETGKAYVHKVKANRKAGIGLDPDDPLDPVGMDDQLSDNYRARADHVVYLDWEHPFSRHARQYHFRYNEVDFYWKGTKTIEKSGFFGRFLRYNHLKLVAQIPAIDEADQTFKPQVCLGTYTCSLSQKKCGRLELYDSVILQLAEVYIQVIGTPGLREEERIKVLRLKKTWFYRVLVATALCMINAEKEKRQMVGEWLENAGEGAGG
ncbi:hypothetical protein K458DRAFT_348793 [Lentithecium fluviatile CBS 122367]|uniref:Uncharacterized protein n=1 Tax=Lentithecium fluviatile CBS 122367 TaxID=1168545 RepID=A0A6G1IJJ1_9PLEO|nr:hypothetical protein K458DRAFT_348793 [Lentithecium fluviatile CBS 122367]